MGDPIVVTYVGLTDREVTVIRSMFKIVPALEKFSLVGPAEAFSATIALVNIDYSPSVRWWKDLRRDNKLVTPIVLTGSEKSDKRYETIRRPIKLEEFVQALEAVVRPKSSDYNSELEKDAPLRVLVVDDSFPVRKFLEHKLPEIYDGPLAINFADSGEYAMQAIWQQPCDIVFLDVVMSGMDGYAVCKAIKADKFAYVVMLTSKKSPFDKIRGTISGCDGYITKPPSEEQLKKELDKCLGFMQGRGQAIHAEVGSPA